MYKKVHFADAIGRSLESVRIITPYTVPDDSVPKLTEQKSNRRNHVCINVRKIFSHRFISLPVSLERVHTIRTGIVGYVRVDNISYEKQVTLRSTDDCWESYTDVCAEYLFSYPADNTDIFFFTIPWQNQVTMKCYIEFAVRYQVAGLEYWDNNFGRNYIIDVENNRLTSRNACKAN
jgi:hypothetical protein